MSGPWFESRSGYSWFAPQSAHVNCCPAGVVDAWLPSKQSDEVRFLGGVLNQRLQARHVASRLTGCGLDGTAGVPARFRSTCVPENRVKAPKHGATLA
jgi:hypothetical protein